jgi:hypothetical protein
MIHSHFSSLKVNRDSAELLHPKDCSYEIWGYFSTGGELSDYSLTLWEMNAKIRIDPGA